MPQNNAYTYHIGWAWYNGSYTMATKPIKFLELHYTMTQLLIMFFILCSNMPFSSCPWARFPAVLEVRLFIFLPRNAGLQNGWKSSPSCPLCQNSLKRLFVQNRSYANVFRLPVHFHANHFPIFRKNQKRFCTRTGFCNEVRGITKE